MEQNISESTAGSPRSNDHPIGALCTSPLATHANAVAMVSQRTYHGRNNHLTHFGLSNFDCFYSSLFIIIGKWNFFISLVGTFASDLIQFRCAKPTPVWLVLSTDCIYC